MITYTTIGIRILVFRITKDLVLGYEAQSKYDCNWIVRCRTALTIQVKNLYSKNHSISFAFYNTRTLLLPLAHADIQRALRATARDAHCPDSPP